MLTKNLKDILDDKLWNTAKVLISHYQKKGYTCHQFQSVDDKHSYRLHLVLKKKYETIGIEIREKCNLNSYFKTFIEGCQARRIPIKIFFAVPENIDGEETSISHAAHEEIKSTGFGLLIVKEGKVIENIKTVSCHRKFALEPGTSLGSHRSRVLEIIEGYNRGECLSAMKDLSEEVEDATVNLALKAARKGKIVLLANDILAKRYDWEAIINALSTENYQGTSQTKYFDKSFSNSMKSFKDVRNLSDHRKTIKEINELEERYLEAMLQGTRLLRKLVAMLNKIR